MKKLIILVLIIGVHQSASSQYRNESIWRLDFHANPLAIVYIPSPRIQFGLEYHQVNNISYGLEFGYGDYNLFGPSYYDNDYEYYELRPTVKFYGGSNRQVSRVYVGAEAFFSFQKEISFDGYYYSLEAPLMVRFDEAKKEVYKSGINIITGLKICAITHITIDLYVGSGVGISNVSYYDMVDPEISSIFPRGIGFMWAEDYPGTEFYMSFTGGIKFGLYLDGKK